MGKVKLNRAATKVICRNLDRIAKDCRKVSAETNRRVSIYTHVQKDGKILITVKPESCKEKFEPHFLELKRITNLIWKQIFVSAVTNNAGQTSSTINADGYRKDHFYDGFERLTYGSYEIEEKQVVFGDYPIGLEADIMLKELRRKRQGK